MKKIVICHDPFDTEKWERLEAQDVRDAIMEKFPEGFPETARIYNGIVSQDHDVTPGNEEQVEALESMEGPFFVVIYPAGETFLIVSLIISIIAVAAVAFLFTPQIPAISIEKQNNRRVSSSNNELSQRSNRPRINGRIPDIFGEVRSTPDMIAVPYTIFEVNQEVEIGYMCIGRGSYSVEDIRDGDTSLEDIAGASAVVYGPFTSPNFGTPQLQVGDSIDDPVLKVIRLNEVNGQVLSPPNVKLTGDLDIKFRNGNVIEADPTVGINFTQIFGVGDSVNITNGDITGTVYYGEDAPEVFFQSPNKVVFTGLNPSLYFTNTDTLVLSNSDWINLSPSQSGNMDGSYDISSVTSTEIVLNSPGSVNAAWSSLSGSTERLNPTLDCTRSFNFSGADHQVTEVNTTTMVVNPPSSLDSQWGAIKDTGFFSPVMKGSGTRWIGPFFLYLEDLESVFINIVALNGLYKDNGSKRRTVDVLVELELTPINNNGDQIGPPELFQETLKGSVTRRDFIGVTIKATPTFTGPCQIRLRRVTETDVNFSGQVVDEVKWRDAYGVSPVSEQHFGNVTTIHTKTRGTTGALSVKDRKLNCLATRKIPQRITGSSFTTELFPSKFADDILSFICLDPYIGNRSISEVDFNSFYDTVEEILNYFGHDEAGEFCFTFDNDNISFEETVSTVCNAVFSQAFRQGNVIKMTFEKRSEDSRLIFNHRNKLPGTETRTVRFGNLDNHDGVEFEFNDPTDDVVETIYIPKDRTAINPKQVLTAGIRNRKQAFFHAWRVWNRVQYQNIFTEFETTNEAAIVTLKDRVLIADNTRPDTQDGEVRSQDVLSLELSQPVTFVSGKSYTIFLQSPDGTVESIPVTQSSTSSRHVNLQYAPSQALSLEEDNFAKATYIIVADDDPLLQAFLVVEKSPKDNMIYQLSAVNYSPLYYQHDALVVWLPFFSSLYEDEGPNDYAMAGTGTSTIISDTERGNCHRGLTASDCISGTFSAPQDYTKMLWVKKDDLVSEAHLISNNTSMEEFFLIDSDGNLKAGHTNNKDDVSFAWPGSGSWHHAVVTYESETTTLRLFIDGVLVDQNDSVDDRSLEDLTLLNCNGGLSLVGRADDIRVYSYAMEESLIKEIFRTTV